MGKFNPQSFNAAWINDKSIDSDCMKYIEQMGMYLCDKEDAADPCLANLQQKDRGYADRPGYNAVTTSQLRNIFEAVTHIKLKIDMAGTKADADAVKTDIMLLRPKIAYQAARVSNKNAKSNINGFCFFAKKALDLVTESVKNEDITVLKKRYTRFHQMMEGMVAYHKVYGGRD